jgi:hypothetical protein
MAAAGFVACGSSNKEPPKDPMAELTPAERQAAQQRASQSDERERQLAASREPQPTVGAPGSNRTSTALAVSSIATARCDRELKCKNVGTNKTYLTTDECVTKMQNDKRTGLNPDECPQGVNNNDLASCLKAIRDEDCGNPLDQISRLTACRAGGMCAK